MLLKTLSRPLSLRILLTIVFLFSAVALAASGNQAVLDGDGKILRLQNGIYGELFPNELEADADSPVLALEVIGAQGEVTRYLVPGTETSDSESSATLIYEPNSQTTYLLWQEGLANGLHPGLRLTSFTDGEWQEVIEIWSGPFARKGSPDLVITREAAEKSKVGLTAKDRTILHLTWWQEAPATSRKLYAPIIIENGQYIGWTPLFDLAAFAPTEPGYVGPAVDFGLADAVRVQKGQDHHSITLGFLHPESHQLITLGIEVLPLAVTDLANKARAHIIEMGAFSRSGPLLAQSLRDMLFANGIDFHAASLEYVANRITEDIQAAAVGSGRIILDPDQMGLQARAHIIEMGARIATNGLVDSQESQILEVGRAPGDSDPKHLFEVTVLSHREAPAVSDGPVRLYLSENGADVLLAWEDNESPRIIYQQSDGDGWNAPTAIEIHDALGRDAIYKLLEQRIHNP